MKRHSVERWIIQHTSSQKIRGDHASVPRGIDGGIDERGSARSAGIRARLVVLFISALAPRKNASLWLPQFTIAIKNQMFCQLPPLWVVGRLHHKQRKTQQRSILLQHLLCMRDTPIARGRIAEEAALFLIPQATIAHLLQGIADQIKQFWLLTTR